MMKGTLVTVSRDSTTGRNYAIYLIKYRAALWIATFDTDHQMIVQVQEATLSEERLPDQVRQAVREWLL